MRIVAIGGGNNSNIKKTGEPKIYEHENIDKEIIRLSGKKSPNVLYVTHASSPEFETGGLRAIKNTYEKMYHCPVKLFSIGMLRDLDESRKLIDWADIIYVSGGNTKQLMELWFKTGIYDKLIEAGNENKVLCGTSAGGGCWFNYSCSDYLQMETGNIGAPFMPVKGLGLVNLVFNPHADEKGRMKGIKNNTELLKMNGLSLTNNMAIEIVDDEYRLIRGISSENVSIEAILSYWKNDKYIIEPVKENGLIDDLVNIKENEKKLKK